MLHPCIHTLFALAQTDQMAPLTSHQLYVLKTFLIYGPLDGTQGPQEDKDSWCSSPSFVVSRGQHEVVSYQETPRSAPALFVLIETCRYFVGVECRLAFLAHLISPERESCPGSLCS